jgi:hypothetical protein
MSNSDSFIDEVNDEVRRDRLFATFRRYGWIGALAVLLIVGGAAWTEYRKADARAKAEALGDQLLAALAADEPALRAANLAELPKDTAGAQAIAGFFEAAETQASGDVATAVAALDAIAVNGALPEIYRQVAAFKSLLLQTETMDAATRRQQFSALAVPGAPLRLLALEQLALIDVAEGATDAALERYQSILSDAAVTSDLQQRALQVIVSLGGTPDLGALPAAGN